MRLFFSMLVLCALATPAFGQFSLSTSSVQGQLYDSETRDPVPDAFVFISNSLSVTHTEEGAFRISVLSLGRHTIVATAPGYEPFVDNILVSAGQNEPLVYYMTPSEKPERPVTTAEERDENLRMFNKFFLGVSPNADKCILVNPEVLHFEQKDQHFLAYADETLLIDNMALGYRLHIVLQDFSVSLDNQDPSIKYTFLSGFEELTPGSKKDVRRWRRARREAYRGSERHFLTSLISNDLIAEGFVVMEEGAMAMVQSSGIPGARAQDRIPSVSPDEILQPGGTNYERTLSFDGHLKVINQNDSPENEYLDFQRHARDWEVPDADPMFQVSWISLPNGPITITTDGRVSSPYGMTKFGYWFFDRVAELLPIEYRD